MRALISAWYSIDDCLPPFGEWVVLRYEDDKKEDYYEMGFLCHDSSWEFKNIEYDYKKMNITHWCRGVREF